LSLTERGRCTAAQQFISLNNTGKKRVPADAGGTDGLEKGRAQFANNLRGSTQLLGKKTHALPSGVGEPAAVKKKGIY